jgi:hypothetical protein
VFSESGPGFEALLGCEHCTRDEHVKHVQDIFRVLGRSPVHRMMLFKFQSATTTMMEIALEVCI